MQIDWWIMSYCSCDCHSTTDGNPSGCNLCLLSHQQSFPPTFPPQTTIDYSPVMLGKLDKIIELLGKLLDATELSKMK